MTPQEFNLKLFTQIIKSTHPNPWFVISRQDFYEACHIQNDWDTEEDFMHAISELAAYGVGVAPYGGGSLSPADLDISLDLLLYRIPKPDQA